MSWSLLGFPLPQGQAWRKNLDRVYPFRMQLLRMEVIPRKMRVFGWESGRACQSASRATYLKCESAKEKVGFWLMKMKILSSNIEFLAGPSLPHLPYQINNKALAQVVSNRTQDSRSCCCLLESFRRLLDWQGALSFDVVPSLLCASECRRIGCYEIEYPGILLSSHSSSYHFAHALGALACRPHALRVVEGIALRKTPAVAMLKGQILF